MSIEGFHQKSPEEIASQEEEARLQLELEGHAAESPYEEKLEALRTVRREGKNMQSLKAEISEKVDTAIEHAIVEGKFIGSGKDAVVFKVADETFSPEMLPILVEEGFKFNTERQESLSAAAKILKIYEPGLGKREYEMQREAFQILSQSEKAAQVPTPIGLRDQELDEKNKVFLNGFGTHLKGNMEVIVMDYVDGKDLATIMYEFVLEAKGYDKEALEKMEFEDKANLVAKYLSFSIPSGKDRDENARAFELAATMNDNSRKLMKYLKQKGFKLDKIVVDKIENALKILSRHGLHHNDMHERNIMIEGDKVFIIDFGRAVKGETDENTDDFAAVRRWKELTTTPEEDEKSMHIEMISELNQKENMLLKNPKWLEKYAKIKQAIADGNTLRYANEFVMAQSSESGVEDFLILTKNLLHDSMINTNARESVQNFLHSLHSGKIPVYAKNKISNVMHSGWLQ
ncbi:MAG TPA: aminoglycoside phosphotransferase family protein [Candidatus Paceibacterota bacterium]|jgi:RIO-like serine/threonine protein kinase|nr:aminoglycoside phosphotransferase family protein [Candidatus Paceibacterota bacterium]